MTNVKAPYTMFGITKMLPVVVHNSQGELPGELSWQEELWVERNEDWYAMHSPQLFNKKVRIITREMWLEY